MQAGSALRPRPRPHAPFLPTFSYRVQVVSLGAGVWWRVAEEALGVEMRKAQIDRLVRLIAFAVLLAALLPAGSGLAQDASSATQLMLDTGGHMAKVIKGLAFTPDGKQLVSASDDKVIRVWDWQSGQDRAHHSRPGRAGQRGQDLSPWRCRPTANGWRRADGRTGNARAAAARSASRLRHGQAGGLLQGPHQCRVRARLLAGRQAAHLGQLRQHGHHLGCREPRSCSTASRATTRKSMPSASRRMARAR